MDPLNKAERNKAVNKFLLLYILSFLAVVIACFFFFKTPAWILKEALNTFKTADTEQKKLLERTNLISSELTDLQSTDKNLAASTNDVDRSPLQTRLTEIQNDLSNNISQIRNDSSSFSSFLARHTAHNYLLAFNTIFSDRNTIRSLQTALAARGGDASELIKLQAALQNCNTQLEISKLAVAAAVPRPALGGGGGGGSQNSAKEAQLEAQLKKTQDDLDDCKRSKTATSAPGRPLSESQKAAVLYDAAQELFASAEASGNPIEKRGILASARKLFEKSLGSFSEPDKINKAIRQIDAELRKLSNMG